MSTETVTLSVSPVELPLVGLKLSQAALSLTDQLSVPPPEFQMLNVWLDGLDPPWVAVKLKLDGLRDMVGGAGFMVRLTEAVCGVFVAPGAEMVMVAL
jgi:hypothetical protein